MTMSTEITTEERMEKRREFVYSVLIGQEVVVTVRGRIYLISFNKLFVSV